MSMHTKRSQIESQNIAFTYVYIKKQASKASLYLHTYSLSLSSCRILSRTGCLDVIPWRLHFSFLSVVFFGAKSIILSAPEWNIDVWTIDIGKRFFVPLSTSKVQGLQANLAVTLTRRICSVSSWLRLLSAVLCPKKKTVRVTSAQNVTVGVGMSHSFVGGLGRKGGGDFRRAFWNVAFVKTTFCHSFYPLISIFVSHSQLYRSIGNVACRQITVGGMNNDSLSGEGVRCQQGPSENEQIPA